MARRHRNPLREPLQYAAKKLPVDGSGLSSSTPSYDYGKRTTEDQIRVVSDAKRSPLQKVIVGAGAAGCVLASRLSEDSSVSVLLLEAGGDNNVLASRVPAMGAKLWGSEHDWKYQTVSQPNVAGRRLRWPRGKMIGGSTSINVMMYHHCSASDFDEWASVYGCKGWGYDDLAPYFRRMERFSPSPDHTDLDLRHRGSHGRWHTGFKPIMPIIEKGFISACQQVGIPAVSDFNTPAGTLGVSRFPSSVDPRGERSSLATAFLSPDVMKRENLYVAVNCHVSKVLFDDSPTMTSPSAVGVEFRTTGGSHDCFQVRARKEVILCGGAVNTPQLLMLSGIGPAHHLEKHGIPVVRENDAVGENMKDHLSLYIFGKAKKGQTLNYLANPIRAIPALLQWFITGGGPLVTNFAQAAAFVKTTDRAKGNDTVNCHGSGNIGPDLEIVALPAGSRPSNKGVSIVDQDAMLLTVVGLRPQSKGSIRLRSADPFETPVIDPRYLTDEGDNDLKVLLAGLRLSLRILRSSAYSEFLEPVQNDDPSSVFWPYSSSDPDNIPDEELTSFLKEQVLTVFHPVGTARMGPSASDSVVDLECRVHGVNRLRVIDASIFPEQISGHPTAPIGAMAYKLSEQMMQADAADRH
ncbi:hypothetical protein CP533_0982 [Ophiocordyceps camponoti-saundersi (nom. inval.)]|nr:hypothetical protein CP533_0982 [Ophiocordyceps camponoti-saundersi (nom. inval.)]